MCNCEFYFVVNVRIEFGFYYLLGGLSVSCFFVFIFGFGVIIELNYDIR